MPKARIVLCCWSDRVDDEAAERHRIEARADLAASSPSRTLATILEAASAEPISLPAPERATIVK
jgi:hypothetical protein